METAKVDHIVSKIVGIRIEPGSERIKIYHKVVPDMISILLDRHGELGLKIHCMG